MKKTKIALIAGVILLILVLIILLIILNQKKTIGGDRNEYGCLVSAGYSWNDSVGACIREWELDSNQREAIKIATSLLSYRVTVLEVQSLSRCFGCFIIKLQRNDNEVISVVELENWEYKFN